jgi:hypothetical protein
MRAQGEALGIGVLHGTALQGRHFQQESNARNVAPVVLWSIGQPQPQGFALGSHRSCLRLDNGPIRACDMSGTVQ